MRPTIDPAYNDFSEVLEVLEEEKDKMYGMQTRQHKLKSSEFENYASSILSWLNEENQEIGSEKYRELASKLFDGRKSFPQNVLTVLNDNGLIYSRKRIGQGNKLVYGLSTEEFVHECENVEMKPEQFRSQN